MDDLTLNDVTLILCSDMNANLSIETHMKYDKLLILRKKSDRGDLFKICAKPNDHILEIKNLMTKFK
jgi:hypothetical protein